MIEFELTNEAESLLLILCEKYLRRRECGSPMSSAVYFGTVDEIRELMPTLCHPLDVRSSCFELYHAGLLDGLEVDNTIEEMELTKPAVIWIQQRFKRGLTEVLDTIGKIRGAILPG